MTRSGRRSPARAGVRYHRTMSPNSAAPPGVPVGPALREEKRAVRERVLAARDAVPAEARAAAARRIVERIVALPSFAAARSVQVTLPFRSEWDTLPLVRAALAAGKTVALPRVDVGTRMLVLHAIRDPATDVAAGYQGIAEPRPHCPVVAPAAIDWVLVPGVAFDATGGRLGYGGGYFDRLLPLLGRAVPRVAGAFALQVVARVPAAPHDLKVDTIVTELQTIAVANT
jgi:5-formyltetrahydrofolate cyclo-ligase